MALNWVLQHDYRCYKCLLKQSDYGKRNIEYRKYVGWHFFNIKTHLWSSLSLKTRTFRQNCPSHRPPKNMHCRKTFQQRWFVESSLFGDTFAANFVFTVRDWGFWCFKKRQNCAFLAAVKTGKIGANRVYIVWQWVSNSIYFRHYDEVHLCSSTLIVWKLGL